VLDEPPSGGAPGDGAAVLSAPRNPDNRRRSRQSDIVASAIRVFARQGFADASIHEIAGEAGVAPTAVYYHFTGKDDLFDVALQRILDSITALVKATRADDDLADAASLRRVILAVWDWLDAHPEEGQLLHHHLPGATPRARLLQQQFEEVHVRRAFDYLPGEPQGGPRDTPIASLADAALAVRTMIHLTILIHSMRAPDGPLRGQSSVAVRQALTEVAVRILLGPGT
jgi:AcrR family transcriptional regulator